MYPAQIGNAPPTQPGFAPQPGYPGYVEQKKKIYARVWFWVLIVLALGIGGCAAILSVATVAINRANTTKHTVIYSVTGTGTATITYDTLDNLNTGEAQLPNVALPWSKTLTGAGLISAYSLTATVGPSGGSATCTITVDGKQISTNSATGALASAHCSGIAS